MNLAPELLQAFADAVSPDKDTPKESTIYATVDSVDGDVCFVHMDGADDNVLTPVSYAANVNPGDRVLVVIRNRQATITGNLTSRAGEPPGYQALVRNVSTHIGNTSIHKTVSEIAEFIYPVGSVYIQFGVNLDGPADLFGFGTWQEILTQADGQLSTDPKYHMWVRTA